MSEYSDIAFTLIDNLAKLDDPDEIVNIFGASLEGLGFHSFLITGLPLPGRKIDPYVILNGWPPEWFERYTDQNYIHTDPIAQNCYTTTNPFLWADVSKRAEFDAKAQIVMDEARDFKMNEGFVIPIFDPLGFQAAVTMAGTALELPKGARPAVHLMAIYVHAAIDKIFKTRFSGQGDKSTRLNSFKHLTGRECEVLKWTAIGKTAWEISQILTISSRTVEEHLAHIRSKLDAATSTQAVVEALKQRLIQL